MLPADHSLFALLQLSHPPEVVDIGANPIDGDPPYRTMLDAGLCRVTGFEPQPNAFAALQAGAGPNERYLPHVVGDGSHHILNICEAPGMTSLFEPDPGVLELFEVLQSAARIVERHEVTSVRLDDIDTVRHVDFLKADVQGAELAILENGRTKLAASVAIQVEVSFVPLYKGQPTIGQIDLELRRQGFLPHCFAAVKQWPVSPCVFGGDPTRPLHQLLEADAVYVRDPSRPELLSTEQLRQLAFIVHCCYGSVDLAMRCVLLLERRGALPAGTTHRYLDFQPKTAQ